MKPNFFGLALTFILLTSAFSTLAKEKIEEKDSIYDLSSEHAISKKEGILILEGHVVLKQAHFLKIEADRAIIKTQNNKLKQAQFSGNPVQISYKNQTGYLQGKAKVVLYEAKKGQLTLKGQAQIKENKKILSAESIQYELKSGAIKASGAKSSSQGTSTQGRVHFQLPLSKIQKP